MRINIHLTCVTFIACTKNRYNLISYKLVFIINTFYTAAGKFDRQITSERFKYRDWCLSMIVSCGAYIKKPRGQIWLMIGYYRSKARY